MRSGPLRGRLAKHEPEGRVPRKQVPKVFWDTRGVLTELIHRGKPWRCIDDIELSTAVWVAWYNQERLHEALGYVPPAEYEAALTGACWRSATSTPPANWCKHRALPSLRAGVRLSPWRSVDKGRSFVLAVERVGSRTQFVQFRIGDGRGTGAECASQLGLPVVTTHSFRKSVATLIDDRGLSARIGADQLGHARPSMTQDVYMTRGKLHAQVADALDDAINVQ